MGVSANLVDPDAYLVPIPTPLLLTLVDILILILILLQNCCSHADFSLFPTLTDSNSGYAYIVPLARWPFSWR